MASFNKTFLLGNLTRSPELKQTSSSAICEFGLAVNRTYIANGEKKDDVCFVDITVWGKQAESCSKYLHKGSLAMVEGRLQFDSWADKQTGAKRSKLSVVAEKVQFMDSKPAEQTSYQRPQERAIITKDDIPF